MIYSPSNLARSSWMAHLSSPTTGFNITYAQIVSQYTAAQPISLDFNLSTSKNVFMGRVDPIAIEESSVFQFPLACIYATVGKNQNLQKFHMFSGSARVITDVHISGKKYTSAKALHDFETWCDAVEHTLIVVANNSVTQTWGDGVDYTGDVGYERQPIIKGGTNWLQTIRLQLTFNINAR